MEKLEEDKEIDVDTSDYVPVEEVSFSFLFFALSGALLFVTVWAFWDDEDSRRGYKQFQEAYFESEYGRAKSEWK